MKRRKKIRETAGEWLEIPGEIAADVPRMELLGEHRVHLENHRGVLHYDSSAIRIATSLGPVSIRGEELLLRNVGREDILFKGTIHSVLLPSGRGEESAQC